MLMSRVTVTILYVFAACGHAKAQDSMSTLVENLVHELADNYLDGMFQSMPVLQGDLQDISLGALAQLTLPVGKGWSPLHPSGAYPYSNLYQPQFFGQVTEGWHTQVDVRANMFKNTVSKLMGTDMDPEVEKRIANGTMTFYDFMSASKMINRMQGLASMAGKIPGMSGKVPTKEQLKATEQKMKSFNKMIDAMDEEERMSPDLFFDGKNQVKERVERVAEGSGYDASVVSRFLKEFKVMRMMMVRLGKGEKPEDIEKDMEEEMQPDDGGNRRYRRQMMKEQKKKEKKAAKGFGR